MGNGFNTLTISLRFFLFEAREVYAAPALTCSPALIKCAFCSHGECFWGRHHRIWHSRLALKKKGWIPPRQTYKLAIMAIFWESVSRLRKELIPGQNLWWLELGGLLTLSVKMSNLLQLCFCEGRIPEHGILRVYLQECVALNVDTEGRGRPEPPLFSPASWWGGTACFPPSFQALLAFRLSKLLFSTLDDGFLGLSKDYVLALCYEWHSYHIERFTYQLPLAFTLKAHPCLQALRTCERF